MVFVMILITKLFWAKQLISGAPAIPTGRMKTLQYRNAVGPNMRDGSGPLSETIQVRPDLPVMDETRFG